MVTYGFFNSVSGDRRYDADQMSEYWKGIIGDGVVPSYLDSLEVSAGTGMTVEVGAGKIYIDSKWCDNDAALTLDITAAHATLGRYTAVIARLDRTERTLTITTKDGTPAASPEAPTMERSATATEFCLAYVLIPAGSTAVSDGNITDKRADTGVCGYAGGVIATASMVLGKFDKTVTFAGSGDNVIPLDMEGYEYSASDLLNVYINGLLADSNDYTLNTNLSTPTITTEATASGTVVQIKITKPIASVE